MLIDDSKNNRCFFLYEYEVKYDLMTASLSIQMTFEYVLVSRDIYVAHSLGID